MLRLIDIRIIPAARSPDHRVRFWSHHRPGLAFDHHHPIWAPTQLGAFEVDTIQPMDGQSPNLGEKPLGSPSPVIPPAIRTRPDLVAMETFEAGHTLCRNTAPDRWHEAMTTWLNSRIPR